ncbi:MAG: hypothetical protein E7017_03500 [Alphaproteobacteria bacterium]|nr:hypothetical protein [Alphaproteobacteria bacterium]
MTKILLSIKPKFVEAIFKKEKIFEYRKVIFKQSNIDTVIIYASKPIKKIVGEFKIGKILCDTPNQIWQQTFNFGGVTKDFYDRYFQNKNKAYAIEITDLKIYDEALDPRSLNQKFVAPQSFYYIE